MKPAEHVRADVTSEGLVVLDINRGCIFTANSIAARIWKALVVENEGAEELIKQIAKEYAVSPEQVSSDLESFLESLRQGDLISET